MKQSAPKRWILGHDITLLETEGDFDLAYLITPPHMPIPGPPPHYHEKESEFFYIIRGEMEIMTNGEWSTLRSGESMEIPSGIVHTFRNSSPEECIWLSTWSPKGFGGFFREFGVFQSEAGSLEKSSSMEVLQRIQEGAAKYGMMISEVKV